jgi:polyphosphate glucokinase
VRIDTPVGAHPDEIVRALVGLVAPLPPHDRIAVGFPGMVRQGIVLTAPNLGHAAWTGYPLALELERNLHQPVRMANDADVAGLAAIAGKGLEMVITLGTGFGTSLYQDGQLCPHLEISQMPFRKGESFDDQLGEHARDAIGNRKWKKRVWRAVELLRTLTAFDHLYIGGGNAARLRGLELPPAVSLVDNTAGLSGGAALWK